jgi:uncharacterized membrane protein (DUF2068 family)
MNTSVRRINRTAQSLEAYSHRRGLRTVAVFEAFKGMLALVAAFGFIIVLRRDVDLEIVAENLLYFLHIDPDRRLSQAFLNAAGKMMDTKIETILAIAVAYAILRFAEGYGLWLQRAWAEWLAIISGCIYLPFEIYRLIREPNELHWVILGINIVVVLYIGWVRWSEIKAGHLRRSTVQSG